MRIVAFLALLFATEVAYAQPLTRSDMQELEHFFRMHAGKKRGDFAVVVHTSVSPMYANFKTINGRRQLVLIFYDPVFSLDTHNLSPNFVARIPNAFLDHGIDGKLDQRLALFTRTTARFNVHRSRNYDQEFYTFTVRALIEHLRSLYRDM